MPERPFGCFAQLAPDPLTRKFNIDRILEHFQNWYSQAWLWLPAAVLGQDAQPLNSSFENALATVISEATGATAQTADPKIKL